MRTWARSLAMSTVIAGPVLGAYPEAGVGPAADPLIGTWKMNAAKSRFSPGPPLKAITATFEAAGQGVKLTAVSVDAQGRAIRAEYTASYDGKDYPISGSATSDTVALRKIGARTSERTDKKNGKVVAIYTRRVSADGKTLIVTQAGTTPEGKPVHNRLVFDRQ